MTPGVAQGDLATEEQLDFSVDDPEAQQHVEAAEKIVDVLD